MATGNVRFPLLTFSNTSHIPLRVRCLRSERSGQERDWSDPLIVCFLLLEKIVVLDYLCFFFENYVFDVFHKVEGGWRERRRGGEEPSI